MATAAASLVGAAPPSQAGDTLQAGLFDREPADPHGIGELGDEAVDLRRGRGRPPGSRNKSTKEWTAYILSRYRSPLIALANLSQANPADLARELECDQVEALRLIISAAVNLAPYLHQKQPLAVQGSATALFTVMINAPEAGQVDQALRFGPVENIEQIQGLIEGEVVASEPEYRNQ